MAEVGLINAIPMSEREREECVIGENGYLARRPIPAPPTPGESSKQRIAREASRRGRLFGASSK